MWDKIEQKFNEQKKNDFKSWYSEKSFVLYGKLPALVIDEIKNVYPNIIICNIEECFKDNSELLSIIVLNQTIRSNRRKILNNYNDRIFIIDGISSYIICKNINKVIGRL